MSVATATHEAYEQWARSYPPEPHNPLMRAEQAAMNEFFPAVCGRRALDLACGTGRYSRLLAAQGLDVIAVDFCLPMLRHVEHASRVCASMMNLPFADCAFDLVLCGLALGHASSVDAWAAEVSRLLRRDGTLLYSDFHPEAARAGLLRSFKDESDREWTVPNHGYSVERQLEAVAAAGLRADVVHEIRVGLEFREQFPKAEQFYRRWHGLPLVLVVRAHK